MQKLPQELTETQQKLLQETAKIAWSDLQRYYAAGAIIYVQSTLDLVAVASFFVDNNTSEIEKLLNQHKVQRANDMQAKQWLESNQTMWAVVTSPWVLVQEAN